MSSYWAMVKYKNAPGSVSDGTWAPAWWDDDKSTWCETICGHSLFYPPLEIGPRIPTPDEGRLVVLPEGEALRSKIADIAGNDHVISWPAINVIADWLESIGQQEAG